MRFITFAAVTVAFIASASAKIGFGSCPETVPMRTWTDYSGGNGFAEDQFYYHEIIAIDNQFDQLLGMAKKFGLKIPLDVACDDLGTVPPFNQIAKAIYDAAQAADATQTLADGKNFNYPAKEAYELLFPPRNDAIVKLVDFLATDNKEAEFYYICVDSFSFPAVLAQVRGMGIPIPPEAIKVIDIVNKLSVIMKKLNLTLKIEGGVVVGARPAGAADVTALETAFGGKLPKYPWSGMKVIDKAACPVPV
jgi:hypothetical protein